MPYKDYEYHKQRVKERRLADPEKVKAYNAAYKQRPDVKERRNAQARKWAKSEAGRAYTSSPEYKARKVANFKRRYAAWTDEKKQKALLRTIKKRAKDRGISFNLEHSKIVWPTHCPVFGTPLVYGQRASKGDWANGASVDRIDPRRGYTLDNIVVMSWRANRIKCDATVVELEKLVSFMRMLSIPNKGA